MYGRRPTLPGQYSVDRVWRVAIRWTRNRRRFVLDFPDFLQLNDHYNLRWSEVICSWFAVICSIQADRWVHRCITRRQTVIVILCPAFYTPANYPLSCTILTQFIARFLKVFTRWHSRIPHFRTLAFYQHPHPSVPSVPSCFRLAI